MPSARLQRLAFDWTVDLKTDGERDAQCRNDSTVKFWGTPMQIVRRHVGMCVVVAAIVLFFCYSAHAEPEVFLVRGWFGVFSTGLDSIADALRGKGIRAEVIGHLGWKTTADEILEQRLEGRNGALVLVGHSQGANNVIDMARLLEAHHVPVALLVTLSPYMQNPIPANVVRAINYYQSSGWGAPITAAPGFRGELLNVDLSSDPTVAHINIDKNANVQAEIARKIIGVVKTN